MIITLIQKQDSVASVILRMVPTQTWIPHKDIYEIKIRRIDEAKSNLHVSW